MFPPGLSCPGFMGQWNWLAAGMANASMAAAAGISGGGGTTLLPLPLPSPFSSIAAQAVGSLPAPGPAMGLASLKNAATAAAAAAPKPGTLGFYPGHYPSPATSIATAPRASDGTVAQAQADRPSGKGYVSSSAAAENGTVPPAPPLPPSFRADASNPTPKAVAATAPLEESSSPHRDEPQEATVSDGSEQWAGEYDEEEAFLATLVNSMDPSNTKTVGVRQAMMSRLKNVGRTVAD